MKIAIHKSEGSFSDYWIDHCIQSKLPYKEVNCYDSDIIQQIEDCDVLLWHHNHGNYKDTLFAKQLLFSLEQSGKKVFPDFNTGWHFDDKVGQKYLLESIGAPLVPSYVFYDKKSALNWIRTTSFPKVFKLRGGAGSANVQLIKTRKEAKQIVNRAFGKGFSQFNGKRYFIEKFNRFRSGKEPLKKVFMAFGRMLISTEHAKIKGNEKGYAYFQDFIPNNDSDIRIVVIGNKAIAVKRMVRKNDFRASGSGNFNFDANLFNKETLKIAFKIAEGINSQCCAMDFIYDANNAPLIVEISYGFMSKSWAPCPGYWDGNLNFHNGEVLPEKWILQEAIK
ncbi:hypothetical protein OO010_02145 [Flavobacteriaceae bacterium KMM 6898]|nr:hypothetical protein [Flavobacteriaceae bacterium KMM 6898]